MRQIELAEEELAAVIAALRRAIEEDRFPRAPRPDPLGAAFAKLDAAPKLTPEPPPKTPPQPQGRRQIPLHGALAHHKPRLRPFGCSRSPDPARQKPLRLQTKFQSVRLGHVKREGLVNHVS